MVEHRFHHSSLHEVDALLLTVHPRLQASLDRDDSDGTGLLQELVGAMWHAHEYRHGWPTDDGIVGHLEVDYHKVTFSF